MKFRIHAWTLPFKSMCAHEPKRTALRTATARRTGERGRRPGRAVVARHWAAEDRLERISSIPGMGRVDVCQDLVTAVRVARHPAVLLPPAGHPEYYWQAAIVLAVGGGSDGSTDSSPPPQPGLQTRAPPRPLRRPPLHPELACGVTASSASLPWPSHPRRARPRSTPGPDRHRPALARLAPPQVHFLGKCASRGVHVVPGACHRRTGRRRRSLGRPRLGPGLVGPGPVLALGLVYLRQAAGLLPKACTASPPEPRRPDDHHVPRPRRSPPRPGRSGHDRPTRHPARSMRERQVILGADALHRGAPVGRGAERQRGWHRACARLRRERARRRRIRPAPRRPAPRFGQVT